jgi:hypothetical protein
MQFTGKSRIAWRLSSSRWRLCSRVSSIPFLNLAITAARCKISVAAAAIASLVNCSVSADSSMSRDVGDHERLLKLERPGALLDLEDRLLLER